MATLTKESELDKLRNNLSDMYELCLESENNNQPSVTKQVETSEDELYEIHCMLENAIKKHLPQGII